MGIKKNLGGAGPALLPNSPFSDSQVFFGELSLAC